MKIAQDPYDELAQIAGRRAPKAVQSLEAASQAFEEGRERDALKIVKPLYDDFGQASGVQELYGMSLYATGRFKQAKPILEDFVKRTGSYDQHPLLMDIYRSEKNFKKVDELWDDLGSVSPSGEVVAEGRIVHSQSLAERGQIGEALKQLRKKIKPVARPKLHHLRLWYCLADLEERAGNIVVARQWFNRISKVSPDFADVSYRLKQLS